MPSIFPQWIQDVNTGLSFISFFMTLYVLFEVKHIKNAFLARARLPELIKELSKTGSTLNTHLGQWPEQRNEAYGQIKIAAALLKSTLGMLPKPEQNELTRIQKKMTEAAHNFSDQRYADVNIAWDLYSDIQACITNLKQITKNMKWE